MTLIAGKTLSESRAITSNSTSSDPWERHLWNLTKN